MNVNSVVGQDMDRDVLTVRMDFMNTMTTKTIVCSAVGRAMDLDVPVVRMEFMNTAQEVSVNSAAGLALVQGAQVAHQVLTSINPT